MSPKRAVIAHFTDSFCSALGSKPTHWSTKPVSITTTPLADFCTKFQAAKYVPSLRSPVWSSSQSMMSAWMDGENQVMDHATLTDNHGREASFRHVTLIMTSNVGARDMAARSIGFGEDFKGDGTKEMERLFSPEFRNRLDEIVRFNQLTPEVMGRVVDKFIREVTGQLREKKVRIELTDAARAWLAEKGYDPAFGARPLDRVIQVELKDKLADEILFGKLAKGGVARVDAGEDALVFDLEPRAQ